MQRANAEADAAAWEAIAGLTMVEERRRLAGRAQGKAVLAENVMAEAERHDAVAKGRIERLDKGEPVGGGLENPVDVIQIPRGAGWTESDMRRAQLLAELPEEVVKDELVEEISRRAAAAEKAARRAVFKRHGIT